MPLRLWRRFRLVPGLRANLSKSGVSLSVGRRGAWYTSGPRGQRVTLGAPGTGLFWTERLLTPAAAPMSRPSLPHRIVYAILAVVAAASIVAIVVSISVIIYGCVMLAMSAG